MFSTFLMGAICYPALELLYRRRTHYSMAIAGGLSTCLLRMISKTGLHPLARVILCGTGITCVEFLCGRVWNRRYQVWDYRHMPLNFRGQVCLPYSLLWCGLSACILPLMRKR